MAITTILFDLDGTLLPMDQDLFTKTYFGLMAKKLANYGYDPKQLVGAIWSSKNEMVKNDGRKSNEEVFWEDFVRQYGEDVKKDIPLFDAYYRNEFEGARAVCGFNEKAAETVVLCKRLGFRVALATNPLFPAIATEKRIVWAGLKPEDFELYTTYENSNYCKPNPDYYSEVAKKLGVEPEKCLMVGNDAMEDLAAEKVGMQVFLLTDCLINEENIDISGYPHGDFAELQNFLERIGAFYV